MRISDWSSDVCSSDLAPGRWAGPACAWRRFGPSLHHACSAEVVRRTVAGAAPCFRLAGKGQKHASLRSRPLIRPPGTFSREREKGCFQDPAVRSEEHTSELQSLMRKSYAVFCLQKTKLQ